MKLIEIFNQLTYGELSQISIGGGAAGEITEDNYDKILIHINLGLTALFKRFNLKEEQLTIALQTGQYVYPITYAFCESNTKSKEAVKYIKDASHKFANDLFKIEHVYTSEGYEFLLNEHDEDLSLFTPSLNILRVPTIIVDKDKDLPDQLKTDTLQVYYRANHPIISTTLPGFSPETYEVDLPYSHLEALLLFVASRVNNPIGLNNEFNAGNTYAAKFEQECKRLEAYNLEVDKPSQNTRLHRNGWV